MNVYIFVAAAVFSVIPLLVIFKVNINQLIKDPKQFPEVQKKFLVGVALSKIVPVILLVFGIVKMTPVDFDKLLIPLLIIMIVVMFGFIFISSQKMSNGNKDVKFAVNTLTSIARPLIFSIPLMAIVFMILMTQ